MLADLRGWSSFIGLQMPYSLTQRTVECELLPMARTPSLCVLSWSPLDMGVLTGKYNRGASPSEYKGEPETFSPMRTLSRAS